MKRFSSWFVAGCLCGGAVGVARTRDVALALLEKNRALVDLDIPALPGSAHFDTMASWKPALAGGLFFALTLGLGFAAACYLWARLCRSLFSRWKPVLNLSLLVPLAASVWALVAGDTWLALTLFIITGGATAGALMGEPPNARGLLYGLVTAALLVGALVPLGMAEEGPFIRLRNRLLLPTSAGRVVNDFYYRWTLYPAQAIKPLSAHTQPMIAVDPGVEPKRRDRFCRNIQSQRLLCVPESTPGADGLFTLDDKGSALVSGDVRTVWQRGNQRADVEAWKSFSRDTDETGPLRMATYYSLVFGIPLALCLLLASVAGGVAKLADDPRRQELRRWGIVVTFSIMVLVTGLPTTQIDRYNALHSGEQLDDEMILAALTSNNPVMRHYGALATVGAARSYEQELFDALEDPIVNVRYAAALSLAPDTPEATQRLLELLAGPEQWYVKERAYAALWGAGWRPR